MTVEEIKTMYDMRRVVERYGFQPNRAGFIQCPFHTGDRNPSMKIYKNDFHCHSCGTHGDIFTFVQMIEQISFKEAFLALGGTYQKPTFSSKLAIYQSKKRQEMACKERERERERKRLICILISVYRAYMERSEPMSEAWIDCYNALQYQLYLLEEINGKEAG